MTSTSARQASIKQGRPAPILIPTGGKDAEERRTMANFMRKASLKMRESARDLADIADGKSGGPKDKGVAKPPKSRSASAANSVHLDEDGETVVEAPRRRREPITYARLCRGTLDVPLGEH